MNQNHQKPNQPTDFQVWWQVWTNMEIDCLRLRVKPHEETFFAARSLARILIHAARTNPEWVIAQDELLEPVEGQDEIVARMIDKLPVAFTQGEDSM